MYGEPWTDEENKILVKMVKNRNTAKEIAKELSRSVYSVQYHISYYYGGMRFLKDGIWSVKDQKEIERMRLDGCSVSEIMKATGRSERFIKSHLQHLPPIQGKLKWKYSVQKQLENLIVNGYSIENISKKMGFTERSIEERMHITLGTCKINKARKILLEEMEE